MSDISKFKVGNDTYNIKDEESRNTLAEKQDVLTFDDEPTANSNNPVRSGGVFDVVNAITGSLSDNAPYILRKALGNLVYEKIVGCSFVKNQLLPELKDNNGWRQFNFTTTLSFEDGVMTLHSSSNGDCRNDAFLSQSGHKYLVINSIYPTGTVIYRLGLIDLKMYAAQEQWVSHVFMFSASESQKKLICQAYNGTKISKYMLIDLTQLFGAEIADYAYSLEQAEAGSGIAWLKSYGFFAEDYIAYDAGSIESVSTIGKKVVGKNLFDDNNVNWKNGAYLSSVDGSEVANSNYRYTQRYISVLSGLTYTLSLYVPSNAIAILLSYYDASYNYLTYEFIIPAAGIGRKSGTFTIPENAAFIRLSAGVTHSNIQLEIGSPATDYEPYKEVVYPLSNRDLLGVPKLVNGHITYDGDIYDADGGVSERYGIVDLGSQEWTGIKSGFFYTTIADAGLKNISNCVCTKYILGDVTSSSTEDKVMGFTVVGVTQFRVRDSAYSSTADFKTAMSGQYLVYEKATPTTASAIPFQNPQRAFIDGTEEFIDAEVPVGHESTYYLNEIAPEIEDYVDAKVKMAMSEITCQETTEGDYTLKATVDANGKVTYEWVAVE